MRRNRWIFFITMLAGLFGGNLRAEDDPSKVKHQALRTLKDTVITAINNCDMKLLNSCFTPDFAFTTVNQTTLTSASQVDKFFQLMFKSPDSMLISMKCKPSADILTRFIDANTGYCYGTNQETYKLKDGREIVQQSRWTAVVVKQNGKWKIAAAHAGVDFLNNPILNHAVKQGVWLLILGFLAGLIVALILMFVVRKLRKCTAKTA
ncbi:MAG: nuclear transport factor 2 family protein [Victivallales bacterium]|nr:nuclear transport factor 2 family protein [Victivallales bacterium]